MAGGSYRFGYTPGYSVNPSGGGGRGGGGGNRGGNGGGGGQGGNNNNGGGGGGGEQFRLLAENGDSLVTESNDFIERDV